MCMLIFQYLDALPPIPTDLLVDSLVPDESQIGFRDGTYTRWAANPRLIEWLQKNISDYTNIAGVQTIGGTVMAHCDKRQWAVNYIIDTGGSNVTTTFYHHPNKSVIQAPATRISNDTKLKIIKQVVIEPGKWHIINTHVLHGVTNIETQRTAITIGLNADDPFAKLKI